MTGRLYGFCAGILRRIPAQKTVFSAQESFAGVLQISEGKLNGSKFTDFQSDFTQTLLRIDRLHVLTTISVKS